MEIENLTDQEKIELITKTKKLIEQFPIFIDYSTRDSFSKYYDNYVCCWGNSKAGHDSDCSIAQLKNLYYGLK